MREARSKEKAEEYWNCLAATVCVVSVYNYESAGTLSDKDAIFASNPLGVTLDNPPIHCNPGISDARSLILALSITPLCKLF